MFLIISAQFCTAELTAEYGRLPPTFLPVGNKRLYELQIAQIKKSHFKGDIYLSLPVNFKISPYDQLKLAEFAVRVIRISSELTIGQAISEAIAQITKQTKQLNDYSSLKILYGDTYIADLNLTLKDALVISEAEDEYKWHFVNNKQVICGYFAFSNLKNFTGALSAAQCDFLLAIKLYDKKFKLTNVLTTSWYDFGHVHTYYKSKTLLTTARHFNSLEFRELIVTKKSKDRKKCEAEANWYLAAPAAIKVHTPNFLEKQFALNNEFTGYSLEYLHLCSLNELFIFAELKELSWSQIISSIFRFLAKMYTIKANIVFNPQKFYLAKTLKRLDSFVQQSGFDINQELFINGNKIPSVLAITHQTYNQLNPCRADYITFVHGDLCFSNILYDFKTNSIKVIDPRGLDSDNAFSTFGDIRYDLAKLAHSIVGNYDLIVANMVEAYQEENRFFIQFQQHSKEFIEKLFWQHLEVFMPGIKSDICNLLVHLFLSMLPLHKDSTSRQIALLANALRLYCLK